MSEYATYTESELRQAALNARDKHFASLVAFALELAVEIYPDEIREAIDKVFNLSALKEENEKAMQTLRTTWKHLHATKAKADDLEKQLANLNDLVERAIGRLVKQHMPATNGRKT